MFFSHQLIVQGWRLCPSTVFLNCFIYRRLCIRKLNCVYNHLKNYSTNHKNISFRMLHLTSNILTEKSLQPTQKEIARSGYLFHELQSKDKKTFLKVLQKFDGDDKVKRGHIEFIYAALKYMEDFGVQGDLEIYKKLMDIFPKGKMIPKNLIQAEFYHFPRHQECAITTLDVMEYNGVCPDKEMGEIIIQTFGKSSHVYKKYARMLYWMRKLKNINPYAMPDPMPLDARELARLALKKMSVDNRTKIVEYDTEELEDSLDKTWIMSAQSPVQQRLIQEHNEEKSLYVEGPTLVWLKRISMTYFVLRADPIAYPKVEEDDDDVSNLCLRMFGDPKPKEVICSPSSVHEQEDGIIMAMCCTGTSSKDSLLSWIRFLRKSNPKLDSIPVLFKIRTSPTTVIAVNASKDVDSDQNLNANEP